MISRSRAVGEKTPEKMTDELLATLKTTEQVFKPRKELPKDFSLPFDSDQKELEPLEEPRIFEPKLDRCLKAAAISSEAITTSAKHIGDTVEAVLLSVDGSVASVQLRTDALAASLKGLLKAAPKIVGEWSPLGAVIARGRHELKRGAEVAVNSHQLAAPLNGLSIRGNLVAYRLSPAGAHKNLCKEEYLRFVTQQTANREENERRKQQRIAQAAARRFAHFGELTPASAKKISIKKKAATEMEDTHSVSWRPSSKPLATATLAKALELMKGRRAAENQVAASFEVLKNCTELSGEKFAECVAISALRVSRRKSPLQIVASVLKDVTDRFYGHSILAATKARDDGERYPRFVALATAEQKCEEEPVTAAPTRLPLAEEMSQLAAESQALNGTRPVRVQKPTAFYAPVAASSGSQKKALAAFARTHGRVPTADDSVRVAQFVNAHSELLSVH